MKYSSEQLCLHAIMYAKGHYQTDPEFSGFKKIISLYSGVEYVDDDHMLHFSLYLLETYGSKKLTIHDFILELFSELRWYKQKDDNVTKMDIVNQILSILRMTKAVDLPPLPQPDPEIWYLKNKVTATDLTKVGLPHCGPSCSTLEHFGASECENICCFKFHKDGTKLQQEDLDILCDDVKQIKWVDQK
jgi:hypothetical protein